MMQKKGFFGRVAESMADAASDRANVELNRRLGKLHEPRKSQFHPDRYPLGLVGESHYQAAIRKCRDGEAVELVREVGNPYDPQAIAAVCTRGQIIGYVPRDSAVHRAVFREKGGAIATILTINGGGKGNLGVVLEIEFDGQPIGERAYKR